MACYRPIKGARGPGGKVTFKAKGYTGMIVEVPCGQCIGCRQGRAQSWATRLMHEAQEHEANSFLTLTYDDANLPPGGSLVLADWQNFAKRVRNRVGPFRFYHCGEYGDVTSRPHYHACIFGLDWAHDREFYKMSGRHPLYNSPSLTELWGKGHVVIGELTFESAAYVARYCLKKITGKAQEGDTVIDRTTGEVFSRRPEYSTMSRRPGIGRKWLEEFVSDVYPDDFAVMADGRKCKPPKFYDDFFEALSPEEMDDIRRERRRRGRRFAQHRTAERLEVRERVAEARQRSFVRE